MNLDKNLIENISYLKYATGIVPINKGFSQDEKYIIDNKYLIRLFSTEEADSRAHEFKTINQLTSYSDFTPKAIEFNTLKSSGYSYIVLTYLPGTDGESALKDLREKDQYEAGAAAGKELKKLHALSAPADYPPWSLMKKQKTDNYLKELKQLAVNNKITDMLESFIKENDSLMENRPNRFQHDDFIRLIL